MNQKPDKSVLDVSGLQDIQPIVNDQPFTSLRVEQTQVDIIGTAHVSAVSRDTVHDLLTQQTYDAVGLELCDKRYAALQGVDSLAEMDIWQVIREKKMFLVMASLLLSVYQRRIGEQLGIEPGAEFKEAMAQAEAQGLATTLIDRDIGISLNRFYRKLKWWQRPVLFSAFLTNLFFSEDIGEEDLENLKKDGAFVSAVDQLWPGTRELMQVLIEERNQYMVAKIRQYICQHKPQRLLVIIGAGHLQGMSDLLKEGSSNQNDEQTITQYCEIPPRTRWLKAFPWLVTGLIMTGFAIGFSRDTDLGISLFVYWFLFNGTLAALGSLLVLAHPLTIAAAFFAAPITSLNPLIGVGVVTTAVQFMLRKPQVSDFTTVKEDMTSFAGWRRNRFMHLFLVFFFSSLGSIIGTYAGGLYIYNILSS